MELPSLCVLIGFLHLMIFVAQNKTSSSQDASSVTSYRSASATSKFKKTEEGSTETTTDQSSVTRTEYSQTSSSSQTSNPTTTTEDSTDSTTLPSSSISTVTHDQETTSFDTTTFDEDNTTSPSPSVPTVTQVTTSVDTTISNEDITTSLQSSGQTVTRVTTSDDTTMTDPVSASSTPSSIHTPTQKTTTSYTSTTSKQDDNHTEVYPIKTVIAASGAAGGLLLVVLTGVTVVCCRRRTRSKEHVEQNDTDPLNFGSRPKQTIQKKNVDHNYIQVDPATFNLEVVSQPTSHGHVKNSKSQTSSTSQSAEVLPRSQRVPMNNNDTLIGELIATHNMLNETSKASTNEEHTFNEQNQERSRGKTFDSGTENQQNKQNQETDGNACHMVDNDIYVGGPARKKNPEERMEYNDLHHSFIDCNTEITSAEKHSSHQLPQEDASDHEDRMMVNDLYHSYNTPSSDQRNCSNEEGSVDVDQEEVMVANELYHSYQSTGKETEMQAAKRLYTDDNEDVTVMNDLYHSYQSSLRSGTQDGEQKSYDGSIGVDDQHPHMVENDLYHSHANSSGGGTAQRVSDELYDEILDEAISVAPKSVNSSRKPRHAAYEEIADLTSS